VEHVFRRNKDRNTPAKCLTSDEPTIGQLTRTYGDDFTEGYISLFVHKIQDSIGVKTKMNDFQIEMCAQMLLEEFKQINLSDLQLVSKRAISGVYGQFYESISIPKVLEWFRLYFEERCETAAMLSTQIKASGQIEAQASNTVKALIEIGIVKPDDFAAMDVNKEEEFRKVSAEYHAKKISKSKNS
jgi:hypothetical protein